KLLDGTEQVLVEGLILFARARGALRFFLEVDEDGELVLEDLGRVGDRVLRTHRAVGPHLEAELVVVCHLPDTRVGDRVIHLADGRVERVDGDRSDGLARLLRAFSRNVATTHGNG